MKNWLLSLLLLLCGVGALAQGQAGYSEPDPEPGYYQVKPGETLYGRFGPKAGAKICQLNLTMGVIKKCNVVGAWQWIRIPPSINGAAILTTKPEAVFRWTKVGGAPLTDCGKRSESAINEEAWVKLGLSEDEKTELRGKVKGNDYTSTFFKPGDRFQLVTYCKKGHVSFERNVVAAWKQDLVVLARTYVLKSGRVLPWVRNCSNWTIGLPIPPVAALPPAPLPPPVADLPPVVVDEPPLLVIIPSPPPKPKQEQRCVFDPKAVLGQEHEPTVDGNNSHSTYLSAALYCTKRDKDGVWGVGVGTQDSWWHGRVNLGAGKFHGQLLSFGPAIERIADKGWVLEGKLLFGRIHEKFSEGEYASHRQIDFVGPSVSYNNYERRERGERFLPETRLFAMAGFATNVKAEHSWQGKPIADTKELSQFGALFQAGVHQDVYDHKYATLWARAGYFSESPVTETANLRIGVSDPKRVCGVGIGLDFDLKHGGEAVGYGWWCDLVKGAEVLRSGYRLNQVSDGVTAAFENGATMTPLHTDD